MKRPTALCGNCGSKMRVIRNDFYEPTGETRRRFECSACGTRETIKEPPPPGYKATGPILSATAASRVARRSKPSTGSAFSGPVRFNDFHDALKPGGELTTLRKG
jgi:DNA-directed RNA polymerase subunit RPC12/RpoP